MRRAIPLAVVGLLLAVSPLAPIVPTLLGRGGQAPIPVTFGPNINLSTQSFSQRKTEREPTISVSPKDPLNVVEGDIGISTKAGEACSFSFSNDGGQTWTFGGLVPTENSSDSTGDPALAADADGNFYYSYLADVVQGKIILRSDLVVAKSTDGGRTFPTRSVVLQGGPTDQPDKDYIGVDAWTTSRFRGNVYVAWTGFLPTGGQIQVATSRDGGLAWSQPAGVGPIVDQRVRAVFGALPVAAPDGTVYVFYSDFLLTTGPLSIMFVSSTDGGQTWSNAAPVASNLPSPGFFTLKNADSKFGQVQGTGLIGILGNSLPTAAFAADGTIFVAWVDFPQGFCINDGTTRPPCVNADVRLAMSRKGGTSWSAPVKVTDETNATDQFFPWIAAHPNGLLSLIWQDKRLDPNNMNFDTFYTNTFDGTTFLPNVRVSSVTSLAGTGQSPDSDYINLAVSASGIFPVWTDVRSGQADIFTASGHFVP